MTDILKEHFVLLFASLGGVIAFCLFRFWPKQTRKALNGMLATVWAAKHVSADTPPVIPPFDATQSMPKVPRIEKETEL